MILYVFVGGVYICVCDFDECIVVCVKVNYGVLGDVVGYGIVGCRILVIVRELIEVGVMCLGESFSYGI